MTFGYISAFALLGQTNLTFGSKDFFQNLKGRSVGKKRKIKKKSPIFCSGSYLVIINKSFLLHVGQTLHPCSDFSKFAFKKCVSMLKLT